MILEQVSVADETRAFLQRWGLKGKYVAGVCFIPERIFSRFMTHKVALTANQLMRLKNYMFDYEQRNQ